MVMDMNEISNNAFKGKYVLVTGSSRGIGKECAIEFARKGATVAIHYSQDLHRAKEVLAMLNGSGHIIVQGDIGFPNECSELISQTIQKFGRIDILVNNAGVWQAMPIESSYSDWQLAWEDSFKTNLLGPANLIYSVVEKMKESGGGRIVNVTSRYAERGDTLSPAYAASKAGLQSFSASMSASLAEYNIFVNAVAPCFVEPDIPISEPIPKPTMTALRAEVAKAILWLSLPGNEFTSGATLDIAPLHSR